MKDYKRLTRQSVGDFKYCLKDHKAKTGEFNDYDAFFDYSMAVKRLGELEDKIERGELIATQLKDTSDQDIAFFAKHNESVRKLFADELKTCLQSDLERGDITQEAYEVIVGKINYCLGEVKE